MGPKRLWRDEPTERNDTRSREVWIDLEKPAKELVFGLRVDVFIDATSRD
jgi:hypothetical protein